MLLTPKYARNISNKDNTIENGIDFCGFLASSPVVAIMSNPMNLYFLVLRRKFNLV